MRIILVLISVGLAASVSLATSEPTPRELALERAANFLWSKQREDGSWRSDYYGVMRSGQSLTPFVFYALMQSTDGLSEGIDDQARNACQFIRHSIDDEGAVGRMDPDILEYPVYSTSYAIEAIEEYSQHLSDFAFCLKSDLLRELQRMQGFLLAAQYRDENGFEPRHVAYGGWGFNAPVGKGIVGHMDIAHTRKALAALADYPVDSKLDALRERAKLFLLLMQKDPSATAAQPHAVELAEGNATSVFDGGFYFSPVALSANKAPYDETTHSWPSYASATCDGILALLAAGVPDDDPRMIAAVDWLRKHPDVDFPQGVPADHPEPWGDAIRFYHYAVRAEVYHKLSFPAADKKRLAAAVLKHQLSDGSFSNSHSPLMKEDDPLVCTSLAMIALAHCDVD